MLNFVFVLAALQVACGMQISQDSLKIVGGKEIDISERPYVAAVLAYKDASCGGVLIANDILLSTAGCIGQPSVYNISYLSVRVGSNRYNNGGQLLQVKKILKHPKYNSESFYDIGIVWLNGTVNVTNASPVALPKANQTWPEGSLATVSGWGSTLEIPNGWEIPSPKLHTIDVPVSSQKSQNCTDMIHYYPNGTLICLGSTNHTVAPCLGDNGGPAVINNTLAGLVWINACLFPNNPGVYINVAYFVDWIRENTGL